MNSSRRTAEALGLNKPAPSRMLVRQMAKAIGIPPEEMFAITSMMFEMLKRNLCLGKEIRIKGFGTFSLEVRCGKVTKVYCNPEKLGKKYHYKRIIFKPERGFKNLVNRR